MACSTCGSELDSAGNCAHCRPLVEPMAPVPVAAGFSPSGDPFAPAAAEAPPQPWKAPLFTILAIVLLALVVGLNYLRALRWADVINPESFGYMLGGVTFSLLVGLLGMYVAKKVRGKKAAPASKALGVAAIAALFSLLGLAGEMASLRGGIDRDLYRQTGNLLKEAAGKQPVGKDTNWWNAVTRDFFRDILEMNQRYAAEVGALDRSAIKDLYSSKSYGGDVHMQKVVTQLHAALAVDEKYASLDPLIKRMEDRVAAADASESQKQEFLKGMRGSLEQKLGPRKDLVRKEEDWMKSTIDLYDFATAHLADYSIQDNKLYFRNDATKREFFSQQAKAIALHNDFLKAKRAMEESRRNNLNQVGVSPSDLTPAQLGKTK
jgi:hypothetical protein